MEDLRSKECGLTRLIRNLPQLGSPCCCTYVTLRTGVILVGWTFLVLSVLLTTSALMTWDNTHGLCTLADCTGIINAFNNDIGITNNVEVLNPGIPLWAVVAGAVCLFSWVFVISVGLLCAVHTENFKIIKLWLQLNMVAWIVLVDLHVINLITLLSRDMKWSTALVRGTCTSAIVALYFHCIVLVKSYYTTKAPPPPEPKEICTDASGFIGLILRKIPQLEFICCCERFSLRAGALTIGYAGFVVLFLFNSESVTDLVRQIFSLQKNKASCTHSNEITQKWVEFAADLLATTVSYAMSALLLIGVYKKKARIIEILLQANVAIWVLALALSVIFYALAPLLNLPEWNDSFAALFGISLLLGMDFYCIVVIKSYYVQVITSGKEENEEQTAEDIELP